MPEAFDAKTATARAETLIGAVYDHPKAAIKHGLASGTPDMPDHKIFGADGAHAWKTPDTSLIRAVQGADKLLADSAAPAELRDAAQAYKNSFTAIADTPQVQKLFEQVHLEDAGAALKKTLDGEKAAFEKSLNATNPNGYKDVSAAANALARGETLSPGQVQMLAEAQGNLPPQLSAQVTEALKPAAAVPSMKGAIPEAGMNFAGISADAKVGGLNHRSQIAIPGDMATMVDRAAAGMNPTGVGIIGDGSEIVRDISDRAALAQATETYMKDHTLTADNLSTARREIIGKAAEQLALKEPGRDLGAFREQSVKAFDAAIDGSYQHMVKGIEAQGTPAAQQAAEFLKANVSELKEGETPASRFQKLATVSENLGTKGAGQSAAFQQILKDGGEAKLPHLASPALDGVRNGASGEHIDGKVSNPAQQQHGRPSAKGPYAAMGAEPHGVGAKVAQGLKSNGKLALGVGAAAGAMAFAGGASAKEAAEQGGRVVLGDQALKDFAQGNYVSGGVNAGIDQVPGARTAVSGIQGGAEQAARGDYLGATATTAEGVAKGTTVLGGALAGAQVGGTVGAFAGPIGAGVGGLVGGVVGAGTAAVATEGFSDQPDTAKIMGDINAVAEREKTQCTTATAQPMSRNGTAMEQLQRYGEKHKGRGGAFSAAKADSANHSTDSKQPTVDRFGPSAALVDPKADAIGSDHAAHTKTVTHQRPAFKGFAPT